MTHSKPIFYIVERSGPLNDRGPLLSTSGAPSAVYFLCLCPWSDLACLQTLLPSARPTLALAPAKFDALQNIGFAWVTTDSYSICSAALRPPLSLAMSFLFSCAFGAAIGSLRSRFSSSGKIFFSNPLTFLVNCDTMKTPTDGCCHRRLDEPSILPWAPVVHTRRKPGGL